MHQRRSDMQRHEHPGHPLAEEAVGRPHGVFKLERGQSEQGPDPFRERRVAARGNDEQAEVRGVVRGHVARHGHQDQQRIERPVRRIRRQHLQAGGRGVPRGGSENAPQQPRQHQEADGHAQHPVDVEDRHHALRIGCPPEQRGTHAGLGIDDPDHVVRDPVRGDEGRGHRPMEQHRDAAVGIEGIAPSHGGFLWHGGQGAGLPPAQGSRMVTTFSSV